VSTKIDDNTAVDTLEFDRLVASTVRAMRQSLGVTVAELSKASGVRRSGIEAIERGGASTRAQRYDIAVAVEWLSNNRAAKRLTTQP
jgi:transcriptional regulator with XRE-family HTH domain